MNNGGHQGGRMNATVNVDTQFWDKIAPKYSRKPVPDEQAYQATLLRTQDYLAKNLKALEIGCGTGTTALHLAGCVGEILATDLSPGMLAIAREKAAAAGIDNVRFEATTLNDGVLHGQTFDVVMAFNLIHLLADVAGAMKRVHELLAPGGLFISKTPCIGEMGMAVRLVIPIMQLFGKAPFVNFVKKESLRKDIVAANFEIIETELYPRKSHNLFIVARKL
jgi:ubiquinone/menaquinone biosynthesis C-methylase UbiE